MNIINNKLFYNYLDGVISKLYKILPLYENRYDTLKTYLRSLQIELIGSTSLIELLNNDAEYVSILATIQYLIDNNYDKDTCKREVFKCIKIIQKLKQKYIIL
jgi:hypothetical protein